MILVSKEEKELIKEKYPYVTIVRTMRQKSKRHRYYVEEAPCVMRLLEKVRSGERLEADTR